MNTLIEFLYNSEFATDYADPEFSRSEAEQAYLADALMKTVTAAMGEDSATKIRDCMGEREDLCAQSAFLRGFCLGGQIVLAALSVHFMPA